MSTMMDRRRFLKTLGAGTTQAALSLSGLGAFIQDAHAGQHCSSGSWGAIVGDVGGTSGWNCNNHNGYKILEIFLQAGASQWESFWLPGSGAPNFADFGLSSLPLNELDWATNIADFPCQAPDIPTSFNDSQLFATQAGGGDIFWGAPTKPIFRRNDIFSRCRMVTQYHELFPHEAAIPYALSGLRLGNPRRSGIGSAVQRRAYVTNPNQQLPVSYILHRNGGYTVPHAAANGTHPGYARPIVIQISSSNAFVNSLARNGITGSSDELLLALRHEFRDRLRFRGAGNPVRSQEFDGYWVASELLKDAPSLQALFGGNILVLDSNVATCPTHQPQSPATPLVGANAPGTKTLLHAAASLLTSGPARYVCTIDTGITGTYDTHGDGTQRHLVRTSANIYNLMHHLADIIHHPTNNPSGVVNLSDTMIVINSEFNRTPGINANNGRDHWPVGYATLLIGGPISGGASIRGAIDASGRTVGTYRHTPTDIKGALLLAAGIDPFADGNFRFGDFSDAIKSGIGTDAQMRDRLRGQILGL